MELLKAKIRESGVALNENVLLVDSFLNNQVDVPLMQEIGREFARRFADVEIDRVVTVESSGIAPAMMTALELKKPLVILKKSASLILSDGILQKETFSFTKNSSYQLTLKTKFVRPNERVLLIDDFLANGQAALGASELIEKAGAKVVGIGIVIGKSFQAGKRLLNEAGYLVEVLAPIKSLAKNHIEFEEE